MMYDTPTEISTAPVPHDLPLGAFGMQVPVCGEDS